jgi:hypothetical protein
MLARGKIRLLPDIRRAVAPLPCRDNDVKVQRYRPLKPAAPVYPYISNMHNFVMPNLRQTARIPVIASIFLFLVWYIKTKLQGSCFTLYLFDMLPIHFEMVVALFNACYLDCDSKILQYHLGLILTIIKGCSIQDSAPI